MSALDQTPEDIERWGLKIISWALTEDDRALVIHYRKNGFCVVKFIYKSHLYAVSQNGAVRDKPSLEQKTECQWFPTAEEAAEAYIHVLDD